MGRGPRKRSDTSRSSSGVDGSGRVVGQGGYPHGWSPQARTRLTALLSHARYAHARGCQTFSVASADHQFTALAELGEFDMIAWTGQNVSGRLRAAACQVRRVRRPSSTEVGPHTRTVPLPPLDQDEERTTNGPKAMFAQLGHRLATALAIGFSIALAMLWSPDWFSGFSTTRGAAGSVGRSPPGEHRFSELYRQRCTLADGLVRRSGPGGWPARSAKARGLRRAALPAGNW